MKKIDSLNTKTLKPKKETIQFLLNFSKSIEIVKTKTNKVIVNKN